MDHEILQKAAEKYNTPLYVYSEVQLRKNYNSFISALKKRYDNVKVLYALKTNSSLAFCNILRQEGSGADVVSTGELLVAKRVGIKPENILYTNNSKTDKELEIAVGEDVIIDLDSEDELLRVNEIAKKKNKKARVSFRVNPSINPNTHPKIATGLKSSKFGVHLEEGLAFKAYEKAVGLEFIDVVGTQTHIGSQITDMTAFSDMAEKMMVFSVELKEKLGLELKFIDFGGGLGIPYTREDIPGPEEYAESIIPVVEKHLDALGYRPELWFEPGRFIAASAGILLTEVTSVKKTPHKNFVNVDSGFNVLLRPAMYDSYHHISVLGKDGEETEEYDIVGNVCESGDAFAKGRKLPRVEKGDILAIHDAGAYGFSMSSNYNLRLRPAEVLITDGEFEVIRKRETPEDFLRYQRVPSRLLD